MVRSLLLSAALLTCSPALAAPPGQGELVVSGAVAGRAWSQAPCKVGDGCGPEPGGFWRVEQRDLRIGLAVSGRWFVGRSPVGLAARYRLAERPPPRATAAAGLPTALEHHLECRLAVRLRAPGTRTAWLTPELGWDLHTWYAWETGDDGLLAEHRIAAHSLGLGLAVSVALTPRLGMQSRVSLDLLPRPGGIQLSEGQVEVGLEWTEGPLLARAAAVARAGGVVATREGPSGLEGTRLGLVDVGLEIGAGFRF